MNRGCPACRWVLALLFIGAGGTAWAMPSAPAGIVESGVPSFVVLGPEAIGLSSAPTDLQLLPDGRILVVSQREIAFGDGVRWESFRGTDGDGGFISAHDYKLGAMIAEIVCGGEVEKGSLVSEQWLLDLERKAFMELLVHPKTQERIMGMMQTGKPVRN